MLEGGSTKLISKNRIKKMFKQNEWKYFWRNIPTDTYNLFHRTRTHIDYEII